jgi:hypothetical protein
MTSRSTSPATPRPNSCDEGEELIVYFDAGPRSVQTAQSYSGEVFMVVSGSGQASGTEYTDAFYRFTDPAANDISPSVIGFSFTINGRLAKEFIPGKQVPPYSEDHVYSFSIMAPGGALSFGVADTAVDDNTGSYQVTVCKQ